jgi:copper oxidase (laccase) domain-containing protein
VAALPDGERLVRAVTTADAEPGHWRLDLFSLATILLERLGVARIDSERISTLADPRCFSHRRVAGAGGRTGRFATVAWLPDVV